MLDIKKLGRPGKGTPPTPEITPHNLTKPPSGLKVHQQVKISPETRRAFRARAAEMDTDLGTLFELMWEVFRSQRG